MPCSRSSPAEHSSSTRRVTVGKLSPSRLDTVSYTHLDVYKRQYLNLPVMGVAVIGTAIALLVFFNAGRGSGESVEEVEVEFEDGI